MTKINKVVRIGRMVKRLHAMAADEGGLVKQGGGTVLQVEGLGDEGVQEVSDAVKMAAEVLLAGEVVAVPTDTVYGVAALVQDPKAVKKLYDIKGRDTAKPIAICVSEISEISTWAEVTIPLSLMATLLPGPVTLVFRRTARLNPAFNPDTELVGVRVPDYPLLREICRVLTSPMALTSANFSSEPSSLSVNEFSGLHSCLGLVLDGGRLGDTEISRLGSTVVDLSNPGTYKVIREGCAGKRVEQVLQEHQLEPR